MLPSFAPVLVSKALFTAESLSVSVSPVAVLESALTTLVILSLISGECCKLMLVAITLPSLKVKFAKAVQELKALLRIVVNVSGRIISVIFAQFSKA